MYVCMYVRTYVRMYVCMYMCIFICMYTHTHTHTHTRTLTHASIHILIKSYNINTKNDCVDMLLRLFLRVIIVTSIILWRVTIVTVILL